VYEGTVRHRRHGQPSDEFSYPLFMMYLDLDELPELFDASRLFSARRPAPAWFRRRDHLGDPAMPLLQSVHELLRERVGAGAEGPVRLLTNLRYFGHCFNPVSFYYCFAPDGQRLAATVAHVTNTPWGESHSYVLGPAEPAEHPRATVLSGCFEKRLHVSPLMAMEREYELRMTLPGERLSVHIASRAPGGASTFDATLSLGRRDISAQQLPRTLARYPLLTMRIVGRIYGNALRLRLKGARYHPHPLHSGAGV
jgi:hypothetical protein